MSRRLLIAALSLSSEYPVIASGYPDDKNARNLTISSVFMVREAGVEQAGNAPFTLFHSPIHTLSAVFHVRNPLFYLLLPPHGSFIREKIRENINMFCDSATQRVQINLTHSTECFPV